MGASGFVAWRVGGGAHSGACSRSQTGRRERAERTERAEQWRRRGTAKDRARSAVHFLIKNDNQLTTRIFSKL